MSEAHADTARTRGGPRMRTCRQIIHRLVLVTLLVAASTVVVTAETVRSTASSKPARSKHRNRTPGYVRLAIEAREAQARLVPEKTTKVWSYNGTVPGPTIEAELGDQIIIDLTNRLPEPTTIHWHGVELDAEMDDSDIAQPPVEPGDSRSYTTARRAGSPRISAQNDETKGSAGAAPILISAWSP